MAPFAVEPEYLALVDPDTLEPVTRLARPALLAIAAHVGDTRLIDNCSSLELRSVLRSHSDPFNPAIPKRKETATCSA